MRTVVASTAVFLLLASAVLIAFGPARMVAGDPWPNVNGDGTSDVVWNFTTPSDYVLTDTGFSAGIARLRQQVGWWNSTSAADFAGPDSATNVDLATFPGNLVLTSTGGASTLLTIQPDAGTGLDTYLEKMNPTTTHGGDTTLVFDPRSTSTRGPVLQFNLGAIPAGAVIDDAQLGLYESAAAATTVTAEVHALTAVWNEGQATWNDRVTGTAWGAAGGDFDPHLNDVITLTNALGWKTWNVTELVDLWYRGRIPNDGLILTGPTGGANTDKTFWSSDYAVDPTRRPKLDIRYRILGATGEYVSKVGGPGSRSAWESISWNPTERSYVTDEFNGAALDPKWTWTNPPAAYDVGTTTPGSLHILSTTGTDLDGGTFSGNVLANEVVGDFIATAKMNDSPTVSGQKAGLIVLLNGRNWYTIQKTNVAGAVNWQAKATADAVSTVRANQASGNPIPAWFRIERVGNTFTASTSPDGAVWIVRDTYTPGFEYPLEVRLALFASDGLAGSAHTVDVDYLRVTISNDATVSISTRLGDTTPVDGSWSGWSAAYPTPAGSTMTGTSQYGEFRVSFAVTYPDHSPDVGDMNISWATYATSGTVETADFAPADLAEWASFSVIQALNGQAITYAYSADSGGVWTPLSPPVSLLGVNPASGKIRFRAFLSTTDTTVTPTITEMRLTYRHVLDHFYVTTDPSAAAGASFSVTVTAKDAGNTTMTWWTGTVTLAARLSDGVTPGGGVLGFTSLVISSGGTATLATETYTKAETIRIRASGGTAAGLSGGAVISPGALDHIVVTPGDVTILPFDSQDLSTQGYDAWDNPISGLAYGWSVLGGVGSLNSSSGPTVNFTAAPPPANGTVQVSVGAVTGISQIHVVSGTRPWLSFVQPVPGAHLTGTVVISYSNSTDAVSVQFEYDNGSGWTVIGTTAALNGTYLWVTTGLDFIGGGLRGIVTNNRAISNTTVAAPIEVDNTLPSITLGPVTDNQVSTGTLTLTYATSADTVRVDLSYFNGTWNGIGSDVTVDGSYVWGPTTPINGVTIQALVVDEVNLTGRAEKIGVGNRTVGANPPSVQSIPTLHVHAGTPYDLNLTFYVSDPDTPLVGLTITVADPANVTVTGGTAPFLSIDYGTTGTHLVTLWVSDGTNTGWTLLTILVEGTHPPNVIAGPPSVAFDEDTTAVDAFGTAATTFFNDLDGDPLAFTVVGDIRVHFWVNLNDTIDLWADPNWYGIATMRIRASDPSGGFAEAAFEVVVLAVNDPPVLAAIPDLTFEAGTTFVVALGPYISDVDTPLTGITVSADSPHVTVSGLNLTLAFPSDWRSATFNVTITDGSGVASQPVRATLMVTPLWWQAPYVLALPPIGVFVVVAMFAQRARWRPAKAFLVDENGRLIREFTMDPSCQVSYDQAVEAGALDAVEKPIKVGKYHAQTVRGDALAVVLLAYGPVTLEQVEFAREMLVQVQDKFEDAVKQRLEEARAYESKLDETANALAGQRTAIESRAGEIESMLRQVEATQAKIATDVASVDTKDRDLKRREELLAEERKAVDDLARELESTRVTTEKRTARLEDQAEELAAKAEAFSAREEAVVSAEAELRTREESISQTESQVKIESETISARGADLDARTNRLATEQETLGGERIDFESKRAAFETEQRDLLEFKRSVDARVADAEKAESAITAKEQELSSREGRLTPREASLSSRETAIQERESDAQSQKALVDAAQREVTERIGDLETREARLAKDSESLEALQRALDTEKQEIGNERQVVDSRIKDAKDLESVALAQMKSAQAREENIAPLEAELARNQASHAARETQLQTQAEASAAKADELEGKGRDLSARELALSENRVVFEEARGAFETDRREFEARATHVEEELRRRREDLDAQAKGVGEAQLRLAQETDAFEEGRAEKNQAILSKEIELEAREQSVREKEDGVRVQVEENGRRLSELAAREETLEIESSKLDKTRAELDARKTELTTLAKELELKGVRLRDEEARRAEELRTWQTTLESEQALLKDQRETFENEMSSLRASWADRMMRIEQREADVTDKEEKVRTEVDGIARSEEELKRREKSAADAMQSTTVLKDEAERLRKELEQRALEIESRERTFREEASRHTVELAQKSETLKAQEAAIATARKELDRDRGEQTARFQQIESDLQKNQGALEARSRELGDQEARLASSAETQRTAEQRLQRDQADLKATSQLLEARELELTHLKERYDSEAARGQSEAEAMRHSLAEREAALGAERERVERDSAALQETLGTKAKEMVAREKAIAAHEAELRAEEQDLEARIRELDTKQRQADAREGELSAQAMAFIRREQDLNARVTQFDTTVKKFEFEAAEKRREWETLQTNVRSQQAQMNATAETRAAELSKRMEELEGRERSLRAAAAQLELERSKIEGQTKATGAKAAEAEASWHRSENRQAELKTKEDELLRARQAFESDRSAWSAKRAEELRQLEATRDAAGEQAQQAERLVAEAQRRAYLAEEAEKASKRQTEQLASQQALLEQRRGEAEKAERDLQFQLAQLRESSQKFAAKEMQINDALRDLEARQGKLAAGEREAAGMAAELRTRKASIDQEATRLALLTDQLGARQREIDSRNAALETKVSQVTTKEQTLTTELQRADNLMEDLSRKERELQARSEGLGDKEADLRRQETALNGRNAELVEGSRVLERAKQDIDGQRSRVEEDRNATLGARQEAEALKAEAEKLRAQADGMQAEVSKNLRFLQKKALDVLDREEKLRVRETIVEQSEKGLDGRMEILEGKERALDADRQELDSKTAKLEAEIERLRTKVADMDKAGGPSSAAMDEWKKDMDNRVKIIQKKAMELLDREEKMRKKEEELRALAAQLGMSL